MTEIRAFEVANRGRRTVVGKIDQLLAGESESVDRSAVAEHTDAEALSGLEAAARAGLVEARGGARWLDAHRRIAADWPAAIGTRTVFVGDDPGRLRRRRRRRLPRGRLRRRSDEVLRIDQVFVADEARELGFGDALVAAAMQWGREHGAELVEAETLPGDRNLKNLYERAGVTARLITVSKRLAP